MIHPNIKGEVEHPSVHLRISGIEHVLHCLEVSAAGEDQNCRVLLTGLPDPDNFSRTASLIERAGVTVCLADGEGWSGARENLELLKKEFFPSVGLFIIPFRLVKDFVCFKGTMEEKARAAADELKGLGARALLITGVGEFPSGMADFFKSDLKDFWLASPAQKNRKGKGKTLAAAIAGGLALGLDVYDSLALGRCVLNTGLGLSAGPVIDSAGFPGKADDFPSVLNDPEESLSFPSMESAELEFYPIVDRASWVARLAPRGVTIMQLRIKDLEDERLEKEIEEGVKAAKGTGCKLFINDYWELAVKHGAYGIHLGQEDLDGADLQAIADTGIRLGVSTHCYFEGAVAKGLHPSYVAFGPVYHTALKAMAFAPQGPEKLKLWRKLFREPLVGIGGVTLDNAAELLPSRPVIISAVRDVTQNPDPEGRVREWLGFISRNR